MIIYVIYVLPNMEKKANYIEIFNEEILKFLELFIIIFSDYNPEPEIK